MKKRNGGWWAAMMAAVMVVGAACGGAAGRVTPALTSTPAATDTPRPTYTPDATATYMPSPAYTPDAATLKGKLLMGYQGWFNCPGDGSQVNGYFHWFKEGIADAEHANFDLWPDTSELSQAERCRTNATLPDGSPAYVYSAYNAQTVLRHFQWMQDYGLDGVMLQRFVSELGDPRFFDQRRQVLANVMAGAEANQRVFAIMYDVSGANPETLVETIEKDWRYLVDEMKVTQSRNYLRHNGKPVLAIWGFGYRDRPGTPQMALETARFLQETAPAQYQVTLWGGVPRQWRTRSGDSGTDPAWSDYYCGLDIINPWTVGAFGGASSADSYYNVEGTLDREKAAQCGAEYMPVVFPGFSWRNLNAGKLNQIPRQGGRFYWRQVYDAVQAGNTMIYNAMFDEVDESTAMFKVAASANALPAQGEFLALDADGTALPSDWYLRLAGEASKMLRGEIPLTEQIPIQP